MVITLTTLSTGTNWVWTSKDLKDNEKLQVFSYQYWARKFYKVNFHSWSSKGKCLHWKVKINTLNSKGCNSRLNKWTSKAIMFWNNWKTFRSEGHQIGACQLESSSPGQISIPFTTSVCNACRCCCKKYTKR